MNARKHNPKPAPPQPTAAEMYASRRNDIARLLDVLQMELDKHADRAKADARNWGLTGDLGQVREDLINLVGFMSGMDPEQVVEFLNDAE
ncbi:MAG: hypothetical protein HRU70_11220 [Phycisphaeraceae bacterium]|nr:MAG: hypothetical protein HRU70_11220 [Phycisphaeraceae bacterium]